MGTVIADRTHTEITALHITITSHQVLGGPTRYLATRYYGEADNGVTIGFMQAERDTVAEARAAANTMWTGAVNVYRTHEAAAQVDPFEVVGEVLAEMTEPGTVELTAPAEPFQLEANQLHERNGEVYKIVLSKTSGKPYAKRLVSQEGKPVWGYAPGAANWLSSSTVMSTERRAELGRIMVHCLDCGRALTHPTSIARGIGPVCSGKGYAE